MHPCLKCGKPERKELKRFDKTVHYQKIQNIVVPVHAGFFPQTKIYSILCEDCINSKSHKS